MPRQKDPIWDKFHQLPNPNNSKIDIAQCKLCDWKRWGFSERLKAHYLTHGNPEIRPSVSVEFPEEKTETSRRSSTSRVKPEDLAGTPQDVGSGGGNKLELEEKVSQLQDTLKTFRAEVDLKMTIMEQILTTRNEQFLVQKKLLEREHALYESVLTHWKNTAELAANGLTLKFSESGNDVDVVCDDSGGPGKDSILGKRITTSAARRGRKKRLRAKLKADSDTDGSWGSDNPPSDNDNSMERGMEKGSDDDDEDGMVRKVFVNFYSDKQQVYGERSNNPVWKHFLREENGKSAMCKICDDRGFQKILKIHDGGTSPLHRHLKFAHDIHVDSNKNTTTATSVEAHSSSYSANPVDLLDDAIVLPAEGFRRIQSPVWNYFTKFQDSEGKKARCNLCYEQGTSTLYLIANGSTSRLHDHIKKVHGVDSTLHTAAKVPSSSSPNIVEEVVTGTLSESKLVEGDDDGTTAERNE